MPDFIQFDMDKITKITFAYEAGGGVQKTPIGNSIIIWDAVKVYILFLPDFPFWMQITKTYMEYVCGFAYENSVFMCTTK